MGEVPKISMWHPTRQGDVAEKVQRLGEVPQISTWPLIHIQDFCRMAGAGLRVTHFSKKFKLDVEVRGCPKFFSRFVQDNAVQAA